MTARGPTHHIADVHECLHRVERRLVKHDRVFLIGFNFLARFFGVAAILAGIAFFVSAYAIVENRVLNIVVGLIAIVMGIAFLVTKSVKAEQLARIRRGMGRPGPPESGV
jgi:cytochrome c biogenesis protein CcdA